MAGFTNLFVLLSIIVALYTSTSAVSRQRTRRSDDLTVSSLQATVEEQASAIDALRSQLQAETARGDSLQASLESVTDVVQELRTKLTATSQSVGFSARFGHDGGQYVGIPLGQHSTLIFDSVLANSGNAYDRNTGLFTAPLAGLYSFFLTQMTADSNHHLWLSIMKNGLTVDRIYTEGSGTNNDTHDQGATQVVTHLQTGDKVWVRQEDGGAVRGMYFTVFTGYLIQAD